jgi:SulP family sulfate permease
MTWVRTALRSDLAAGVTVAAMLVPQAMAYALLAGLPPQVGLYASTVPLLAYAAIGTSRQLAVGPVAIVSLLTASALAPIAEEGSAGYIAAAGLLALVVAVVHLVLGVGRLGFLVRLLSHPVLVGFTAAAALIIGTSQLKHVLGTSPGPGESWLTSIAAVAASVPNTHVPTFVVGAGAVALMALLRRFRPTLPAALIAVAVTTVASVALDLPGRGVAVVGDIPRGLPPLTLPADLSLAIDLVPAALAVTLVGMLESIAIAKVYARRNQQDIDANRELLGLGAANLASGLVGGYPVTGGFSRTAVNAEAGATTRAAGIITALIMLLVLVALTPLFTQLPQATLGAVVLLAVAGLIDLGEVRHIVAVKPADGWTLAGAFVATLALGVELGIAVSAIGSAVVVFARIMRPHTAVLGRLPDADVYRNVDRYPDVEQIDGVVIIRFDVSLSYLNTEFMKDRIRHVVDIATHPHALVLDMSGVNDIDSSAAATLTELIDELDGRGVAVHLASAKGPVRDVLRRTDVPHRVAGAHLDIDRAVAAAAPSSPVATP